ncbi:acyltransferase family protein [Desulfoplanes formicivorans]|uniref:Acyltransferase n=1 Tax=Desulfoplanes formicivorans TaxID=1592317 RepID=A0A194AIG9_9BACT|nr:acyltransferase [Desulfoplanes formicivorans]GAU09123.1 acyltransferase [Desulfoplanes formicivorans]
MTTTNTRKQWVDTAKGIGIILVVYGHVLVGLHSSQIKISPVFFRNSFDFIWSFHMHLFFFLAGMFAIQSLEKRNRRVFVMHKVRMIAYPYFLWSLVQGLLQVIMGAYVNSSLSFADILKIPYRPLPNQHFWFLYVLFVFFVIMAFFYTNRFSLVLLSVTAIVLFFLPFSSDIRVLQKIKVFFVFFMIGALSSKIDLERFLIVIKKKINFFKILSLALVHMMLFFIVYNYYRDNISFFFFSLFGIFNVIMCSCFLDKILKSNMINFIGKYSLQIYILHSMSLASSRIFLYRFLGIENIFLHIILGFICGLCLPLWIGYIVHQKNYNYIFRFDH